MVSIFQPGSDEVSVAVAGGGPAGIGAAVAAARLGARVTLIERHPVLGGMGTAALVSNFCPAHFDRRRFIIDGVFGELRQRLITRKAIYAIRPGETLHPRMEPYDPEVFAFEAAALCREAGVTLRLGRRVTGARFEAGRPCVLALDDGARLTAGTVVDATGDAVLAAQAGTPIHDRENGRNGVMPLSLSYLAGPIDLDALERFLPNAVKNDPLTGERYCYISGWRRPIDERIRQARATGELSIPRDHISAILSVPGRPHIAMVNFGRVNIVDPTRPDQLHVAESEGRRQAEEGIRFFRKHLPGMANAEIVEIARQIGVRESRQVVGRYTLTGDDVRAGRQFDDCIAQCCYAIDIHHNNGRDTSELEPLAPGRHFDIPWRCLIPKEGAENLVVAGRCISADQAAMSSFRVSPSCMAIGQAAGVGAALAHRDGVAIHEVPYDEIRRNLLEQGAMLA